MSFDQESECFTVDVFSDDGLTSKLAESVHRDPDLLEKDDVYCMNLDGELNDDL